MTFTAILIICVTISIMSCIMGCFPLLKASERNKFFIPDTMIDAKTLLHKERKTGWTDAEVERMMGKPKNILDIDYEVDDGNNVYFEIEPTEKSKRESNPPSNSEGVIIKGLKDRTPEPTMRIVHEGFVLDRTEPIQVSKIRKIMREGKNTFAMHEYSYIPQRISIYVPKDGNGTKYDLIYNGEPIEELLVENDRGIVRCIPLGVTTERV